MKLKQSESMRCFLFILFLICEGGRMYAAKDIVLSSDYFTCFSHLTAKDGLSADNVLNILQDRYGIMWFATTDGLVKYDGNHYTTYNTIHNNPNSLSANLVTSIVEDSYGHLWVGTADGLNRYDRRSNTFIREKMDESSLNISGELKSNYIKALYADNSGCLWVETSGGFLSQLDWNTKSWRHFKHYAGSKEGDYHYWHIYEDSYRDIWIGGRALWGHRFSRLEQKLSAYPAWSKEGIPLEISCFVESEDGELLCPNEGFLAYFDRKKGRVEYRNEIPVEATSALRDDDGNIWIGGSGGLICLDRKLEKGVVYKNSPGNNSSLLSNRVNCLYKGKDGIIWIGTDKGICYYSKTLNAFRHYRKCSQEPSCSLSSNSIQALMQDRDELLWVGTEDCGADTLSLPLERVGNMTYTLLKDDLNKITASRERSVLEQYRLHEMERGINENSVSSFYQDSEGIIYIGLWSHVGFNTYNKKSGLFKRYALWSKKPDWKYPFLFEGNPFGANWYTAFVEDDSSRLWCATWEGFGLNLFDRITGLFDGKHYRAVRAPTPPKGGVTKLVLDRRMQRLYIGGGGAYYGYYRFDSGTFKRYGEILPPDYPNRDIIDRYYKSYDAELIQLPMYFLPRNILWDGQGHIWLTDEKDILKHTPLTNHIEKVYSSDVREKIIWFPSVDKQSVIIGQRDKLFLLSVEGNRPVQSIGAMERMLKGRTITALYEDSQGCLWVGTDSGLWRYHRRTGEIKKIFLSSRGNPILDVSVITSDGENGVCVGHARGLARLREENVIHEIQFDDAVTGLPGSIIRDIYPEKQGRLWIATNDGLALCRMDINYKLSIFRSDAEKPHHLIDNDLYAISLGLDSALWLATSKGICVYYPENGRFEDKSKPDNHSLTSRLVSCMIKDHAGNLWLGTTEKGLNMLNLSMDTVAHYMHHAWDKNGLPDPGVNCLFEDSRYRVWVGTPKGLCRYNSVTDNFEYIKSLGERKIQSIQEDLHGYLWVSTDKGLYCLTDNGAVKRSFYDFHGLQGNSFNERVSCRLQDGRLAFGGDYGFNVFRPDEVLRRVLPKPVVFSDFEVHDSVRFADMNGIQSIRLSYMDNSFSVSFTATDYEFNEHLSYRYRLRPFDKEWIYTKAPFLKAKYTNLPWGGYQLEVEASNSFGEWRGSLYTLAIDVATPWYCQWWFIGLSVIVLFLSATYYIRYRERRLQLEKKKLENMVRKQTEQFKTFFTIISHDLKGPCKGLELLSGQLEEGRILSVEKKNLLWNTTRNVNDLLNKLLEWARSQEEMIKPDFQKINLHAEVEDVLHVLRPMADAKGITLSNQVDFNTEVYTDVQMLDIILRNLISNAIKYSYRDQTVVVRVLDRKKYVEVSVVDYGVGIDKEKITRLFRLESKLQTRGTEREQGTGMGLKLVHGLIVRLGEDIRVESRPGKETVFILTLHKNIQERWALLNCYWSMIRKFIWKG